MSKLAIEYNILCQYAFAEEYPHLLALDRIGSLVYKIDHPTIQYHKVLPVEVKSIPNFEKVYQRIIVLNPYSNTEHFNKSDYPHLEKLVSYLKSEGYIVYTNVVQDLPPVKGSSPLRCGIEEFWTISKKIPLVISIRSGILDYIITSGANIFALYSEQITRSSIFSLLQWQCSGKIEEMNFEDFFNDKNFEAIRCFLKKIDYNQ